MFQLTTLVLALSVAGSVTAAPAHLNKRIAQVISASTTKWEAACDAAKGGQDCNSIAVKAFGTLLAAAGPCDQQNNADIMMDLSKKLNSPDMIKFAQIFAQQPRNTPNSLSVPYCQQAPRNAELNGLFQCQFQGANPTSFVGGLKPGDKGTIPFGQTTVLSPPGSCPAHTSGPIADGTQLTDQVNSPGVPSSGNGSGNGDTPSPSSALPTGTNTPDNSSPTTTSTTPSDTPTPPASSAAPSGASPAASPSGTPSSTGSKGFVVQNGKDAQALNEKFATLTADSPCKDGEEACVNGEFAQCSNGKFVTMPCSGGTQCVAVPLVNSPGTSITCDTKADADKRIATALGTSSK